MEGLGLLGTLPTENLVIGFRVFVVGFLGVVFCVSLLAVALKLAVDVVNKVGQRADAAAKAKTEAEAAAKAAKAAAKASTGSDSTTGKSA